MAITPTTKLSVEKTINLKSILHRPLGSMEPRIDAAPYLWPHDSTFDPKTTALVIIDMQNDCKYNGSGPSPYRLQVSCLFDLIFGLI
jgi:hypothetical protein